MPPWSRVPARKTNASSNGRGPFGVTQDARLPGLDFDFFALFSGARARTPRWSTRNRYHHHHLATNQVTRSMKGLGELEIIRRDTTWRTTTWTLAVAGTPSRPRRSRGSTSTLCCFSLLFILRWFNPLKEPGGAPTVLSKTRCVQRASPGVLNAYP